MAELRFSSDFNSNQLYWLSALAMLSVLLAIGEANSQAIAALRQGLSYPLAPLVWVKRSSLEQYHRFVTWSDDSADKAQLEQQYQRLKLEHNLSLQLRRELELENDDLRTLLCMERRLLVSGTGAQIIGIADDLKNFNLTIGKGSRDGVAVDHVVINKAGLVGQVENVGPNFAQIIPITNARHYLPVRLGLNQGYYIAQGVGDSTHLFIDKVSSEAAISVGDWVYTSGLDGRFPAGIAVGRISAIEAISNETFSEVVIALSSAELGSRHVLVLPNTRAAPPPQHEAKEALSNSLSWIKCKE